MNTYYTHVQRVGDNMCLRGIKDGQPFKDRVPYDASVYIECDQETGFKNIKGHNLKPLTFSRLQECFEFCRQQRDTNLTLYGFPHYHHSFILENYQNAEKIWNREDLRVFNIDIEVYSAEGFPDPNDAQFPVVSITVHDSKMDKFLVFADGAGSWNHENSELSSELLDKTYYIECKSEIDLLNRFVRYWQDFTPDIVTGWNVEFFDLAYIYNRMEKLGLDVKRLSPWRWVATDTVHTPRGLQQAVKISGVSIIDYLKTYRKQKVQDSYRLDNIAEIELGEKKLDYSEVSSLHQLYKTNYQKFIDYNIQDVNLVKRLDEKLGLIDAQIALAYMACLNYDEVESPVRMWDALINKELNKDNIIPHYHVDVNINNRSIAGGYVKEPQIGKHGWCASFDLNSLYPHLIIQFNVSPETMDNSFRAFPELSEQERITAMLERKPHGAPKNLTVTASGQCFRNKSEGIIPKLMRSMYLERKTAKKKMIEKQKRGENYSYEELRQYVLKIALNSGYGALANKYYRWFDNNLAESITLSGQLAIQNAEKSINTWMNKVLKTNKDYVIAIDTDSNYVNMQPLVDKMFPNATQEQLVDIIDKICEEQIQKAISDSYLDMAEYTHSRENAMVMEREAIASSSFWTAKKRYAMAVWNMEGVAYKNEPKVKIQGLEAIRSSTPGKCRQPLLDIIKLTLLEDENSVQQYISEFKQEFMNLRVEDIAMPRTMNNIRKQTRKDETFNKGTPPHVRGAIVFNRMLQKHNLKNWETIKDGEKGKFIYLFQPNNVGTDVISFSTSIPDEFDCKKYVDKNKMFEKVIIDPVEGILEKLGWSSEKKTNLLDFFS